MLRVAIRSIQSQGQGWKKAENNNQEWHVATKTIKLYPPESFVLRTGDLYTTLQSTVFPASTFDDWRVCQRVPRGRRQERRQEEVIN
ncbi:UNVERIFIED_CONTAM: hypothetical protein K2H54_054431 [Gekko kuhli]